MAPHIDGLLLRVRLTPNASHNRLLNLALDGAQKCRLKVAVTGVPEKGKANKALVRLIAKKLRLPPSAIRIIAGQQSREKTLLIGGPTDELSARMKALLIAQGLEGQQG